MADDTHIMVDIETMDTSVEAAILSIGAVSFNPWKQNNQEELTDTFYTRISLNSNTRINRTISADTVYWWLGQSDEARRELIHHEQVSINVGLNSFLHWLNNRESKPTRIWANSPDFDCSILSHAVRSIGGMWPFHFADNRCVRTAKELAYPDNDHPLIRVTRGVAHNALDDAMEQTLLVQNCYYRLHNIKG